jgi:hypothetical protein
MISASGRKLKAEELQLTIVVDSENSANERTKTGNKDRSFTHTAFFCRPYTYAYVRAGWLELGARDVKGRYHHIFCGPKGWDRTVASKALDGLWRSDAGLHSESMI